MSLSLVCRNGYDLRKRKLKTVRLFEWQIGVCHSQRYSNRLVPSRLYILPQPRVTGHVLTALSHSFRISKLSKVGFYKSVGLQWDSGPTNWLKVGTAPTLSEYNMGMLYVKLKRVGIISTDFVPSTKLIMFLHRPF